MEKHQAHGVERIIALTLQIGVLCSAVITLAGFLLFLFTGKSGYPGHTFPTALSAIFQGVTALRPYALILLGIFILVLTPVLRVGISIFLFMKEKDHAFVKITLAVFTILIISFLLGFFFKMH